MTPKMIVWYACMSIVCNHIRTLFIYNIVCFYGPQRSQYNEFDLYLFLAGHVSGRFFTYVLQIDLDIFVAKP